MFSNLHVTDFSPASGEVYTANREWCLSRGARVHPMPVSAFDYKHQLKGSGAPEEFDLILCFGLCMGIFDANNSLTKWGANSSVSRQYNFLGGAPHQQIFNEALMGQSYRATHVLCHVASQARGVSPCAINFPFLRGRAYNPADTSRHLTQLMGRELEPSREPMVANISGPGARLAATHTVATMWNEYQIDLQSMVLTTLNAGGTVLVLGAGQMRFLPTLDASTPLPAGLPILKPTYADTPKVTKRFGTKRTYSSYCLTRGHDDGTADHDDSVVGRVNFRRLRRWCDNTSAGTGV